MGQVTAGWALYGKRPGSSDDYGVLNCSLESFSQRSSYERILHRYGLGTPLAARTGEGVLPWVAVSWVGKETERKIGMSVEEWTDHRDGAGRPVSFTKYVCVPYRQLEAAPISYGALYREVARLDLPMDGEPGADAVLTLPDYDPVALARDIERFGTERVMLAAAMLLDGKVDVVQAGETSIWDRLAFLDAVAALLPYGYRAGFTGGTWATGSAENIRLLFARRARPGNREFAWRGTDEQPRLSDTAREYLRRLRGLLDYFPDLSALVAYLAQETTLCDFRDPRHALERAADVRWPRDVAAAVRSGTARTDDARRLLRSPRRRELTQADRGQVLEHLARAADPDDLELIGRCWGELAAVGGTANPAGALLDAAAALLWRAEPDERTSRYLDFARNRGILGWFLGELVRCGAEPGRDGVGYRAARKFATQLINDYVDPFDPADAHAGLAAQVAQDRELAAALLAGEGAGRQRIEAWTKWLRGGGAADLMTPFRNLLDGREFDLGTVRGLAKGEPELAVALMEVAARISRLRLVLPALAGWLREDTDRPSGAGDFATRALKAVKPPDYWARGAVDSLLLMLGATPRYFEDALSHPDFEQYQSGFCWAWDERTTRTMEYRLVVGLSTVFRQRPWAGGPDSADNVINLMRELIRHAADVDWDPVASVLVEERRDPVLGRRPAYGELRAALRPDGEEGRPAVSPYAAQAAPAAFGAVQFEPPGEGAGETAGRGPAIAPVHMDDSTASTQSALAHIGPDSTLDQVTDAYLEAVLTGDLAGQALTGLVRSGRPLTVPEIIELMRRVEYEVTNRYNAQQADDRVHALVRSVAQGTLGEDVAAGFRHAFAHLASERIRYQVRLLDSVAAGDEDWKLAEPVRVRLDETKKLIEAVLKRSGGKKFLGRNR